MKLWHVKIHASRSAKRLIGEAESITQVHAETAIKAMEAAIKMANLDDTQDIQRIEVECLL